MTGVNPPHISGAATLADVVRQRAGRDGDGIAYTFLADGAGDARSMTWSQLHHRANAIAAVLRERGASGQPVLLALPSGLAFVESLFGCWYAGAVIVPVSLPRHQRVKHRLNQIIADAGARFAIGFVDARQRLESGDAAIGNLTWIDPSTVGDASIDDYKPAANRVALLQYTSGSTGTPRGVVVTHANLMRNSALIAEACGHAPGQTIAGWLPLFHDMGLIGLVLQAAFAGTRCVFMPPERFLMRPWLWLQMISDYGACSSPAPNFGYDLCVDKISEDQKATLDLRRWRTALNGSEPVRAATLDRFAAAFTSCGFQRKAFFPCYGLAESTLFVTGADAERRATRRSADATLMPANGANGHVSCGRPFGDTQLAIVDPHTRRQVALSAIGEIWVAGESCADGYWNNPSASAETFGARLSANQSSTNPSPASGTSDLNTAWLRTGDLGFIAGGELFITGRLRELIIVAGRNHFPVDLERTVESADPAIPPSGAAAFSVDMDGAERLIIAAEMRREFARPARSDSPCEIDTDAICRRVRAAVAAEHEVTPHEVVLLRPGALPRTTSGKLSRRGTRDAYLSDSLERFAGALL